MNIGTLQQMGLQSYHGIDIDNASAREVIHAAAWGDIFVCYYKSFRCTFLLPYNYGVIARLLLWQQCECDCLGDNKLIYEL